MVSTCLQRILFISIFYSYEICSAKRTQPPPTVAPDAGAGVVPDGGDTLTGLMGPVQLNRYTGSGVTATSATDLNCDFSAPCCWSNVGPPKDNLEWVTGSNIPDTQKFQNLYGTSELPQTPYLITSSAAGTSTSYGILNSCAMQCQSDTGTLTLKKWTSPQVNLDVCTLPVGSDQFGFCQTLSGPGPTATVNIPPQNGPFQIVIAASNFVLAPGGAAIIDDITYQSTLTQSCNATTVISGIVTNPQPIVTVGPTITVPAGICSAIFCNFDGSLCAYNGAGGTCPFTARSGRTGCWAGGVPSGPSLLAGGPYAGAELGPTAKATLQSGTFTNDQPMTVKFNYYDGPAGNTLKGCVDSEANCPFVSNSQSMASDRTWKQGTLDVPPGTHSIYFTAANNGGELSGVGIGNVGLASYGGQPASCKYKPSTFSVKFFANGGRVVWIDGTNSKRAQWIPPLKPAPSARLNQAPQASNIRQSPKALQQKKLSDSSDVLPVLFGQGIGLAPLVTKGDTVSSASDLNCDFSSSCCWTNVETPRDELDWLIAQSNLDPTKAQTVFQTSSPPQTPFLLIASPNTNAQTYGILQSCTISCQSDAGTLKFNKWTSQGVAIDVCTLPVGATSYSFCQTVDPSSSQSQVTIPPQSQPFQIIITASEFTNPPGGAAALDDITYTATLCPTTGGGGSVSQVCQAISCNMNTLCTYGNKCSTNNFVSKVGPSGTSSGGIPMGPGGPSESYASAELPPNSKAVLQSQSFTSDQTSTVNFKYFDSGSTAYKVCIDSDASCPFQSAASGTSSGQWRDGTFTIPPGTHTVYFLACHASGSTSYGGIDNIVLASYGSTQNPCPNSRRHL